MLCERIRNICINCVCVCEYICVVRLLGSGIKKMSDETGSPPESIDSLLGYVLPAGRKFGLYMVLAYCFACDVTYLILAGDQIEPFIGNLDGWLGHREFWIAVLGLSVVAPISFFGSVDSLAVPGAVGIAALIVVSAVLVFNGITGDIAWYTIPPHTHPHPHTPTLVLIHLDDEHTC